MQVLRAEKMVRMIDDRTGEIVRDTVIEQILRRSVEEIGRYSFAFVSGSVGCFLIQRGVSNMTEQSRTLEEHPSNQTQRLGTIKRILNWLCHFFARNWRLLWNGGLVGIGFWILLHPLIRELRNLNQKVIYYVN